MKYNIIDSYGEVIGSLEFNDNVTLQPEEAPSAPPAPPAPPATEVHKVMTDQATFAYEQYIQAGWSDDALVANGLMRYESQPVEQPTAPAQLHPQAYQEPLVTDDESPADAWQTHEPEVPSAPPAPEPPAAPSVTPQAEQPAPAPPAPTETASAPGVPDAPVPPAPESSEKVSGDLPEGLSRVSQPPQIQGREFIVRGTSYEDVVDGEGVLFDGRIHGVSQEGVPAVTKSGTFKKKRGVDPETFKQVEATLKQAMAGGDSAPEAPSAPAAPEPEAPSAPSAPEAPAAPAAPEAPSAPEPAQQNAPATAPEPPSNMDDLEAALKDWGEEV